MLESRDIWTLALEGALIDTTGTTITDMPESIMIDTAGSRTLRLHKRRLNCSSEEEYQNLPIQGAWASPSAIT